jgi:uracil phosphoribosyltransferase
LRKAQKDEGKMGPNPLKLSEIEHRYGDNVHILHDPFLTSQLATLCAPTTIQPGINELVRQLYTSMIRYVVSAEFPRVHAEIPTRMMATNRNGVFRGEVIDKRTPTVVVDIARAGIIPAQICYDTLNYVLDPQVVRQDHLVMARTTNQAHQVTGASISGSKIGGSYDDCMVLFPDPMGATGGSLCTAIQSAIGEQKPTRVITMNLIVTPEFIKKLTTQIPNIVIYALRLDRGMSPPEVLACVPGERWDEESGLDERQYIVPGGGGFGELMNNSWV